MHNPDCFVLIRGMLREARHWGNFADYFRQRFPNATILTPDLPGNGRFCRQNSPDSIAAMTEALRRQIDDKPPLHLVAISMGGMIALDWMTRYPQEIASAVLINTSARKLSPFYRRLRWQVYPTVLKMLFRSKAGRERDILALTSNRYRNDGELLNTWRRWQQQYPVSSASARRQLTAAAKFQLPAKPGQPILIVASEADRLVDYRCSLELHQLWQTDYRRHPTAGHDLPLDEPLWLAETLEQWFDTLRHR